jgi:hypothetical protein
MQQDIWTATENWIKVIEEYYKDVSDLNQVFARGYFAGWSERQVLEMAQGLKESEEKYPRWDKLN